MTQRIIKTATIYWTLTMCLNSLNILHNSVYYGVRTAIQCSKKLMLGEDK